MKTINKTGNPANLWTTTLVRENFICPQERQMIHFVKEWDLLLLEAILIDPSKIAHGRDLLALPRSSAEKCAEKLESAM